MLQLPPVDMKLYESAKADEKEYDFVGNFIYTPIAERYG